MKTLRLITLPLLVLISVFFNAFPIDNLIIAQKMANNDAIIAYYSANNSNSYATDIFKVQDFQNAPINSNSSRTSNKQFGMNSCDSVLFSITQQNDCCFSLTLENNIDPNALIMEIEIEAVSNMDISVTNPARGWLINPHSNQLVGLSYPNILIPTGVHPQIVDVCLSNYNSIPQTFKIKWLIQMPDGTEIPCEEFFEVNCLPSPSPKCANVVKDSIYCDESGQIFYQFDIQNNTHLGNPFTIGQIHVNLATPDPSLNTVTPTVFPVPNLQPGNATTGGFFNLQLSGPGVIGGAPFCFTITVHDTAEDPLFCCTDTLEHCVLIPVCDDCCDDFVKEVLNSEIECDLSAAPIVTFIPPVFARSPTWVEWDFECDGTIDFVDSPYTGVNPTNNYGGGDDDHVACLTAYRIHGEDTCCVKQTKYVEEDCCKDPNFENEVAKGYTVTGNGLTKTFTPNGNLGDCDRIEWVWRDGSPRSQRGHTIGKNSISHTFPASPFPHTNLYRTLMFVRRFRGSHRCKYKPYSKWVAIPWNINPNDTTTVNDLEDVITILDPNDTTTVVDPDASIIILGPNDTTVVVESDEVIIILDPNDTTTVIDPDDPIIIPDPNDTTAVVDPKNDPSDVQIVTIEDKALMKKEALSIFPNPTTGQLHIELPTAINTPTHTLQLQLRNIAGKTVLQQELVGHGTLLVDVKDLPNGVYLLHLFDTEGKEQYYQRVVKQ